MSREHDDIERFDDHSLLTRASAGDVEALGVLYDRHGETAYRLAFAITGNSSGAQDAVATGFRELRRRAPSLEPWQPVAGLLLSEVRRHALAGKRNPVSVHERMLSETTGATARLGDRERQALELAYVRGLGVTAIGEIMGLTPAVTREVLRSALDGLRKARSSRDASTEETRKAMR